MSVFGITLDNEAVTRREAERIFSKLLDAYYGEGGGIPSPAWNDSEQESEHVDETEPLPAVSSAAGVDALMKILRDRPANRPFRALLMHLATNGGKIVTSTDLAEELGVTPHGFLTGLGKAVRGLGYTYGELPIRWGYLKGSSVQTMSCTSDTAHELAARLIEVLDPHGISEDDPEIAALRAQVKDA